MAFQDEHAPSIPFKVLLSTSILAGTLISALVTSGHAEWLIELLKYERVEGNGYRKIIILSCCLIYFIRFATAMFVFVKRKIGWFEGGLVSILFFMMFYHFGISAGSHPEPIGIFDITGILLFLFGSYINTFAEYQRFAWKRRIENKGRLYTGGLFKYSMHINYFGDAVTYIGLALITMELVCFMISIGIIVNFIVLQIPMQDKHLCNRYENEFTDYAKDTKKFIPFIY